MGRPSYAGTAAADERIEGALVECWANTPRAELAGLTPWEAALSPAGRHTVEALVREHVGSDEVGARHLAEVSRRLPTGRCVGCFEMSGGLLNAFNETYEEVDDERWPHLVSERIERVAFINEDAREAARREAERVRNDTPSELWSGLTPAEVFAGGGKREAQLLRALIDALRARPIVKLDAPGERIRADLFFLRSWQSGSHAGIPGRAVAVIHDERSFILRRKLLLSSTAHPLIRER